MKHNLLVKLGGVVMVALSSIVPRPVSSYQSGAEMRGDTYPYQRITDGQQYPFELTPEGLIGYLNSPSITWEDGQALKFFNPRKCERVKIEISSDGSDPVDWYECEVDYEEVGTLGKRTCTDANINYNNIWKRYGFDEFRQSDRYCTDWEKVAATPEPQSQATPPPQPQTSTTTSTTLNNNLILAGGAGIFVAGGLLGVAFSKLLGRKKD